MSDDYVWKYAVEKNISLLDYFAGCALKNSQIIRQVVTSFHNDLPFVDCVAEECYDYAEAMLEERKKRLNKGGNDGLHI